MSISATNLAEAIEKAHAAIRVTNQPTATEDEKHKALRDAAALLCDELTIAKDDKQYWAAVSAGQPHRDAASLTTLLGDLAENKDGRRDDLAKMFRSIGYRPPENADEVVRGLVDAIYAGSLLGMGQQSPRFAGRPAGATADAAHASMSRFADQFCAAEQHFEKSFLAAKTDEAKQAINRGLKKVVLAGVSAGALLLAGLFLPPMADRLPPEATAYVCNNADLAPERLQEVLNEAFCIVPLDSNTAEEALHQDEVRKRIAALESVVAELDRDIAATKHRTAELKAAEAQSAKVRADIAKLREAARKLKGLDPGNTG